jgi:hypothetical protein
MAHVPAEEFNNGFGFCAGVKRGIDDQIKIFAAEGLPELLRISAIATQPIYILGQIVAGLPAVEDRNAVSSLQ